MRRTDAQLEMWPTRALESVVSSTAGGPLPSAAPLPESSTLRLSSSVPRSLYGAEEADSWMRLTWSESASNSCVVECTRQLPGPHACHEGELGNLFPVENLTVNATWPNFLSRNFIRDDSAIVFTRGAYGWLYL